MAALIAAREAAHLTQRQLAAKSRKHQSFIAKIETKERNLSLTEFIGLAVAIGADPVELLSQITAALPSDFDF